MAGVINCWRPSRWPWAVDNGKGLRVWGIRDLLEPLWPKAQQKADRPWHYCYHIDQIGQQAKLLLQHTQQGFKPQTSMDQEGVNVPLMGNKLTIIGWVIVALANWAMANIDTNTKCMYIHGLNYKAVKSNRPCAVSAEAHTASIWRQITKFQDLTSFCRITSLSGYVMRASFFVF